MLKTLAKIILWLLLLIAIIVAIFILVNWRDEPLKPEVQAILDWQPPAHYHVDNGYLVLLGMNAPAEQDAALVGEQLLNAEIARFKQMMVSHQEPPNKEAPEMTGDTDWKAFRCVYHTQANCVEFYLKLDSTQLSEIVKQHQVALNRFEAIKKTANFVEVVPPMATALVPHYITLMNASELKRIEAIKAITQQQNEANVLLFVDNALFSRRFLKDSSTLISHMVALSLLQRDAQVLSELLDQYPVLAQQFSQQLSPLLASIDTPELSIKKAFVHERKMMLPLVHNLKYASAEELFGYTEQELDTSAKSNQRLLAQIYQGNATSNLLYDIGTLRLALADAEPASLEQVNESINLQRADYFNDCLPNIRLCFKNPVGKILASISEPNFLSYIQRHHDTEGYLRLVNIQLQLLANPTPSKQAALLAQYLNPYTLKPMAVDSNAGKFIFEGKWSRESVENSQIYSVNLKPTLQ